MQEIPATLDELLAQVGKMFHCMQGPPMAYFHIPLTHTPGRFEPGTDMVERLVYASLRYATNAAEGAETRLVHAMLEPFIDARRQLLERDKDDTALLFWRSPPKFSEGPKHSKALTCRVVIPGASLAFYDVKEGDGMHWV